jgi:hypothetical protein
MIVGGKVGDMAYVVCIRAPPAVSPMRPSASFFHLDGIIRPSPVSGFSFSLRKGPKSIRKAIPDPRGALEESGRNKYA